MSFGKKLRKLRKRKGLSQARLGESVGYSQAQISNYEHMGKAPDLEVVKIFVDFFEVDLLYLYDNNLIWKPSKSLTPSNEMIAAAWIEKIRTKDQTESPEFYDYMND